MVQRTPRRVVDVDGVTYFCDSKGGSVWQSSSGVLPIGVGRLVSRVWELEHAGDVDLAGRLVDAEVFAEKLRAELADAEQRLARLPELEELVDAQATYVAGLEARLARGERARVERHEVVAPDVAALERRAFVAEQRGQAGAARAEELRAELVETKRRCAELRHLVTSQARRLAAFDVKADAGPRRRRRKGGSVHRHLGHVRVRLELGREGGRRVRVERVVAIDDPSSPASVSEAWAKAEVILEQLRAEHGRASTV